LKEGLKKLEFPELWLYMVAPRTELLVFQVEKRGSERVQNPNRGGALAKQPTLPSLLELLSPRAYDQLGREARR